MLKIFITTFFLTFSFQTFTKVVWGSNSQLNQEEKNMLSNFLYLQCKKFASDSVNAISISESKEVKVGQTEYYLQFFEEGLYDIEMFVIKTKSDKFVDFESLDGCI